MIICFADDEPLYKMILCNVIKNAQGDHDNYGIFLSCGNTEVNDSCFIENFAKNIFYEKSMGYMITVSNCFFDEDVEEKKNEYVTITNKISGSFMVSIAHILEEDCRLEKYLHTSNLKNKKQTFAFFLIKRYINKRGKITTIL